MRDHLLSLLLWLPLLGALVVSVVPRWRTTLIRVLANVFAIATAGLAVWITVAFRQGQPFQERVSWIPALGVQYLLGVDGINLLLVVLTAVIGAVAVLCSWRAIQVRERQYYALLLVQQTAMLGVFLSLDFLLFFLFWELTLIPMYFLIAIWGGERRMYAALKFVLYTLTGSVFLLLGGLLLVWQHAAQGGGMTFELAALRNTEMPFGLELLIFWAFFAGFAVKVPMWPLHTWLPDAHVEAPTAGSVVLAGVLLKMGTYGFLRFSLPLTPHAARDGGVAGTVAVLSIVAILYGGLVSLVQKDWKRLIAYSSISHLGFCTLGIFALNANGLGGSVLQQVNHGISASLLFLLAGMIYERRHTREIAEFGGLAHAMPHFAKVFAFAMFSSAGLPLLNGFVGEFTILQGVFAANRAWAGFAVVGIVLSAAYLLWLYQRTMLGTLDKPENVLLPDLSAREWGVLVPLMAWALWIGVYPKPFFDLLQAPVQTTLRAVEAATVARR